MHFSVESLEGVEAGLREPDVRGDSTICLTGHVTGSSPSATAFRYAEVVCALGQIRHIECEAKLWKRCGHDTLLLLLAVIERSEAYRDRQGS